MAAYARLGYHYNRFGVDEVENFAVNLPRIPSEILSGATIGVLLDVPQFNPKIAFRIGADMLVSAKNAGNGCVEAAVESETITEAFNDWFRSW